MVRAPKIQWSVGAQYEIPLAVGHLRISANVNRQDNLYWDFANQFEESARTMVSGAIAWSPSDRWEVSVWGRNLLDEEYSIHGLASPFGFLQVPGAPRTYGVRLRAML
jgi:iron complex outermembrane receptor protein